jgi:hypothetical protein
MINHPKNATRFTLTKDNLLAAMKSLELALGEHKSNLMDIQAEIPAELIMDSICLDFIRHLISNSKE